MSGYNVRRRCDGCGAYDTSVRGLTDTAEYCYTCRAYLIDHDIEPETHEQYKLRE